MNKVILMGRLTRDPEVRYTQSENPLCIARYTLAIDRRGRGNEETSADFPNIIAFGKSGEFAEKYFRKGMKILVTGRIQTGSYDDKDGKKVYTTDVVAEDQEFCESKNSQSNHEDQNTSKNSQTTDSDGFMNIPKGIDDELPFA